jgi:hypothetical protein
MVSDSADATASLLFSRMLSPPLMKDPVFF